MKKLIVADTNIWLLNPHWYEQYDATIAVPNVALEELDSKKNAMGVLGLNARMSSKILNQAAQQIKGSAIKSNENSLIQWTTSMFEDKEFMFVSPYLDKIDFDKAGLTRTNDNIIIISALALSAEEYEVTLLSNDCNVRTKTLLHYQDHHVDVMQLGEDTSDKHEYYATNVIEVNDEQLGQFYSHKLKSDLETNSPVYLRHKGDEYLGIVKDGVIVPLPMEGKRGVYSLYHKISAVNNGQKQLVNLIKDQDIKVVACVGRTGSGKTLVSLASALKLVEDGEYAHIRLIKPVVSLGNTVGFLKGTLEDKIEPIKDSFNSALQLMGEDLESLEQRGQLSFAIPEYERGKTYYSTILIVDECQNLTDMEIKSLITRCSESCKVILLGDIKQIDNLYLSEGCNGLSYTIQKLSGQDFFAHIYLNKSERSKFVDKIDDLM